MKVKELIEKLQEYDQEKEAVIFNDSLEYEDILKVWNGYNGKIHIETNNQNHT